MIQPDELGYGKGAGVEWSYIKAVICFVPLKNRTKHIRNLCIKQHKVTPTKSKYISMLDPSYSINSLQ